MDGMVVVAIKALGGTVAFFAGLTVGSLVAAIWVRLGALWLRIGNIPYLTAFKAAILANVVVVALNFLTGVNHGLTVTILPRLYSGGPPRSVDPTFAYSPMYFLCARSFP